MGHFVSRLERFGRVASTQRVVREWLAAGTPEVAVAVADEQVTGHGRQGRAWQAPPGTALLLTAGFRPAGLPLARAWRLAAIVSLAMVEAAEAQGLADGTIRLKWPNDLVADLPEDGSAGPDGLPRKLAGVLGEVEAADDGTVATCLVGIGVNVDWAAADFPPDLAPGMTSLRELAHRPVDREALLDAFLARLEPRYDALRGGRFDSAAWSTRQRTTGAQVRVAVGREVVDGLGAGVDPASGALLLEVDGTVRAFDSAEVLSCRLRAQRP